MNNTKALEVSGLRDGFVLPREYVTHTGALIAVRGAGKTNAARVMAEEMFDAGLPFVVIDPVGSWRGLRAGRDGTPEGGIPIPIFGGEFGDVPLTSESGEFVADLIARLRLSCILDLTEFDSEASKKRFLLSFAKELFRLNRHPLHCFFEEADDYIPQRTQKDDLLILRAFETLVRRGRSRGLGMTFITQRCASLNKNVLTQVETLFTLRTTGPQDVNAVLAWVNSLSPEFRHFMRALPSMESGEAIVWSPHFLKKVKKIRFRLSRTFDSGATPTAEDPNFTPATLADVDMRELRAQMLSMEGATGEEMLKGAKGAAESNRAARIGRVAKGTKGAAVKAAAKATRGPDLARIAGTARALAVAHGGKIPELKKLAEQLEAAARGA